MFTGIVQYIYYILLQELNIYLYADSLFLEKINIGDSVAINGVCLTVVEITDTFCRFELSEETITLTNFKKYLGNSKKQANIELALKYGDHLGGHIMLGHVHQIGTLVSLEDNGEMWIDLHRNASTVVNYK